MVIAKPRHENLHLIQKICYKRPSLFCQSRTNTCYYMEPLLYWYMTTFIYFINFLYFFLFFFRGEGEGAILKMSFPQGLILGLTHLLTLSNENISKEEIP